MQILVGFSNKLRFNFHKLIRKLIGNAFNGMTLAAVLIACMKDLPWPAKVDEVAPGEVGDGDGASSSLHDGDTYDGSESEESEVNQDESDEDLELSPGSELCLVDSD